MSSLIYLAFSLVTFIITFGIMFYLLPMILGVFFSASDQVGITDLEWLETNEQMQTQLQWLIPLTMAMGMFIFVMRVLMAATARGRD